MRGRNPTNELRQKHSWAPCAAVAAGQGENNGRHVLKPLFFSLRANSSSTFPEPCPPSRQRNWSSWCGTGSCIRRGGWPQPIESRSINSNNLIRTSEADWVSRRSHHDPGVGLSLPKDGWKRAIDAVKGMRLAICKLGSVAHCHPRLPRGEASSSKQPPGAPTDASPGPRIMDGAGRREIHVDAGIVLGACWGVECGEENCGSCKSNCGAAVGRSSSARTGPTKQPSNASRGR